MRGEAERPLIAHVLWRLDVGGLENGLVNLINRLPADRFRHAVVSLTDYTDFRSRIVRPDVEVYALRKRQGNDPLMVRRLWRLFGELRPAIVHTRNLAALDAQLPATMAGVPVRLHGEHGRDMGDLDGESRRYRLIRRLYRPLVHGWVALSADLANYLTGAIGVPAARVAQIYNGVDVQLFRAPVGGREPLPAPGFDDPQVCVIGTVGRMAQVKDQLTLVRAFLRLLDLVPGGRQRLRLALVGDGPLREEARSLLAAADALPLAWLPGTQADIPRVMRGLDVFVLPSLAEGVSNTILEAMATGLPVVATHVGGNPELVIPGETGELVPRADPVALGSALSLYVVDPEKRSRHGAAGRTRAVDRFSVDGMVGHYARLYDSMLSAGECPTPAASAVAGGEG